MSWRKLERQAISQPHSKWSRALALFLLMMVILCPAGTVKGQQPEQSLRVLFIGNSLTYTNDLPSLIEALAVASKQRRLDFKAVVFGGYSLEDHWQKGEARQAIAQGGWDVVVMQQGPSASPEGRQSLLQYARRFVEEIRRSGAQPALYMVWPSTSRQQDFDGVMESYRQAAKAAGGLLFPVGAAWRGAWKREPQLEFYSTDGLHPTVAGSYLAALVIYEQLYRQSPVGLPHKFKLRSGVQIELPEAQARLMQAVAAEVNKNYGRR